LCCQLREKEHCTAKWKWMNKNEQTEVDQKYKIHLCYAMIKKSMWEGVIWIHLA
jgi:hypothetical protein